MLRDFEELDEDDHVAAAPCGKEAPTAQAGGAAGDAGAMHPTATGAGSGSAYGGGGASALSGGLGEQQDGGASCVACHGCLDAAGHAQLSSLLATASSKAIKSAWGEASSLSKQMTDLVPGHAAGWTVRGMVATNTNSWQEARGFFETAIRIVQDDDQTRHTHLAASHACLAAGDQPTSDAHRLMAEVRTSGPGGLASVQARLGHVLAVQGHRDLARPLLEAALAELPGHNFAGKVLGTLIQPLIYLYLLTSNSTSNLPLFTYL